MKKMISALIALAMLFALAACSQPAATPPAPSSPAPSASEPQASQPAEPGREVPAQKYKIAILEVQLNDESINRVNYFNDYIAPAYNCEFMFSEACTSIEAAMTFIENAADAGCKAIISYLPIPSNTEQLVQLAQEYGMVYVENGGRNPLNETAFKAGYENFAGGFMADQPDTGRLFHDYLLASMPADGTHGFVIATGAAYQGNPQQTEISKGMMTAISEVFGLTFDAPIMEYITSASPVAATNDKGIEVYCYPGLPMNDGWREGLSAALQTGKYDHAMFAVQAIGGIETVISEAEGALDKDITVVAFGTFGAALQNALNSKDQFGNPIVSMSTVKFTSIVSAMGFSKVYNLLSGHTAANNNAAGEPEVCLFTMQAVTSAEQLAQMEKWDQAGTWVADIDFVDSLLGIYNPGLTAGQVQQNVYGMTYDVIAARLG